MGIRAAVQSAEHERIESQDERQAIIPASEPTGRRAEAEPGGDPAQGLAEENEKWEAVADETPQAEQADEAPSLAGGVTAYESSAEEQLIKNWPTLDEPDGGGSHHARRWTFLVAVVVVAVAGGSYAVRVGPTRSRGLGSSCSASPAARAPVARVSPELGAGQGVGGRGPAPFVDQGAGLPLPVASATAAEQLAVQADNQARTANTAGQEPGSQSQVVSGETPSRVIVGRQAQPPTPDVAPPTTEGLNERCRKANAGGKGKPMTVLAACHPAIDADPEAADIMVMLARSEIDLGRPAEAQAWAEKALRIKRDLADAYVLLGGAEQEMGKSAEARAAYRKYLELAPTGRHARELRAVLDSLGR